MPRAFTQQERAHIRDALLQAGRHALAKTGMRKTSVASLCQSAGISKGAFYLFFERKEDLIMALMLEAEADLRAQLDRAAVATADSHRQVLMRVLTILFEAVHVHPLLRALGDPLEMAWLVRGMGPEAMLQARLDDERYFTELVSTLSERGHLRSDIDGATFTALAGVALSMAHGRDIIGPQAKRARAWVIAGLVERLAPPR